MHTSFSQLRVMSHFPQAGARMDASHGERNERWSMQIAMMPHRGGWIESVGWVCERCGSESMDLDLLREVPCDGG